MKFKKVHDTTFKYTALFDAIFDSYITMLIACLLQLIDLEIKSD